MAIPVLHPAMVRIAHATPAPRLATMAIVRLGIGSIKRRPRRLAITVAQAQTIAGYKARGFLLNIAASTMWSTIGATTACASRHVATTGCNMAVTICWWRSRRV